MDFDLDEKKKSRWDGVKWRGIRRDDSFVCKCEVLNELKRQLGVNKIEALRWFNFTMRFKSKKNRITYFETTFEPLYIEFWTLNTFWTVLHWILNFKDFKNRFAVIFEL